MNPLHSMPIFSPPWGFPYEPRRPRRTICPYTRTERGVFNKYTILIHIKVILKWLVFDIFGCITSVYTLILKLFYLSEIISSLIWYFGLLHGVYSFIQNESDKYRFGLTLLILECPAGTYKNIKGVGNCIPCPEKSTSYAGATNCTCDRGTFRSETDSIDGDCKAPPAPIDTADLTVKRSSSKIQISWPKSDDDVTYR